MFEELHKYRTHTHLHVGSLQLQRCCGSLGFVRLACSHVCECVCVFVLSHFVCKHAHSHTAYLLTSRCAMRIASEKIHSGTMQRKCEHEHFSLYAGDGDFALDCVPNYNSACVRFFTGVFLLLLRMLNGIFNKEYSMFV